MKRAVFRNPWLPYVLVADSKKVAEKVQKLGGRVVNGPMEVPGGDWIVQCLDPQGVLFAVHSKKPAEPKPAAKKPAKKPAAKKAAKKRPAAKKAAKKKPAARKAARKKVARKKVAAKRPSRKPARKARATKKRAVKRSSGARRKRR